MLGLLVALVLQDPSAASSRTPQPEVIADIRVHGNVLTPDAEIRRLAGVEVGAPFTPETPALVAGRLRAAQHFERVEVLKRFASIADPTQILLVIVVDEGPVKVEAIQSLAEPDTPARVLRRSGLGLMVLPILDFEDGYGFTYGARLARPEVGGRGSRLSFPLTWGGEKRAAAELEKTFAGGPLTRVEVGVSISRRTNPFYQQDDDRGRLWLRGERALSPSLKAGATAGWQHVSFMNASDRFTHVSADITLDTRLDPVLARNAVYAHASVEHLSFETTSANRTDLEVRGYAGLRGQSVLVVRVLREDADAPLPPYLQPLLGGMDSLRGFRAGTAAGDTLVAGSAEVLVPLTSPLSLGKFGVNAFVDTGTVYDKGQRFADQRLERGVGGGIWVSAAFFRMNLVVAHGIGASTRVHFGTSVSF